MVEPVDKRDKTKHEEFREMDKEVRIEKRVNGKTYVVEPEVTKNGDVKDDVKSISSRKSGGVPLDHGWAWFVLLGACLEMTIIIGLAKSSGILFVAFQEQFRSSSSATSLISTVQNAVYSISALMVMTVFSRRFSARYLLFCGAIINCVAFIISSQAESIHVLLLSHGILQGIATAFLQPSCVSMVGQYFDKRRGLANSLSVSGGSLGGLVLAPVMTALLGHYGYRGCMLIIAGLVLNCAVSGALLRPPSFYTKRNEDRTNNRSGSRKQKKILNGTNSHESKKLLNGKPEGDKIVLQSPIVRGLKQGHAGNGKVAVTDNGHSAVDPRLLGSEPLLSEMPRHQRKRTFTEIGGNDRLPENRLSDDKHVTLSREYITGSHMDIPVIEFCRDEDTSQNDDTSEEKSNKLCNMFKAFTKLFDFKLFKDPVFVCMEIGFGLICSSMHLTTVFIVPYAREVGVDASKVATIVTIFSALDMCCRIITGVIADFNFVRRSTIISICGLVVALTSFLLKFYTSYGLIIFCTVMLGLFSGGYFALFAVVIVDYMTIAKLHSCIGFTTMFHGTFVATGFIISGILRDRTGSYVASFYYLGAISFLGATLVLALPHIERIRDRRRQRTKDGDV